MSLSDFVTELRGFTNLFLEWFDACRRPVAHCDELLALASDREKIVKSMQLWIPAFVVGLILQFPVLKNAGIEFEEMGYHLPNFLTAIVLLMLIGAVLHYGLRIHGIASRLGDIVAAYTTLIGVYSPLFLLPTYPLMALDMGALKEAKAHSLSFLPAMVSMMKAGNAAVTQGYMGLVEVPLAIIVWVASLLLLTFMARKVSVLYSVPKSKALSSFAFGIFVLFPPLYFLSGLFSSFVLYTSVK